MASKYLGYLALCCCSWCIASIVFTALFANEMYWYKPELPATCNDGRQNDTSVVTRIDMKLIRSKGSNYYEYACNIYVDAATDDNGLIRGKVRAVGSVYSLFAVNKSDLAVGRAIAERECQRNARDGFYDCFVIDTSDKIEEQENHFPDWQLALMIISLVCCCICCCACLVDGNKESLPTTRDLTPKRSCKTSSEDDPKRKLISPQKVSRIAAADEEEGATKTELNMGHFRALVYEDLCDELIPGLRLRVMFPKVGPGRRWFSAIAVSYDRSDRSVMVKFEDDTNVSRLAMVAPSVTKFRIWENTVRLHETALTQVAKRRILKGVIQGSLFNNITFDKLDADGNGSLDRSEIEAVLAKNGIVMDEFTMNALFERIDVNKDGHINAAEFKDFLTTGDFMF